MKPVARDTLISLALCVPVLVWVMLTGSKIPWGIKNVAIYLILSPIAEELIFRGGLQDLLANEIPRSWPKEIANIITSVHFAIVHLLFKQDLSALLVFFPSLVLGWHYRRHKSIKTVIFIHFFYNFILFM